MTVSRQTAPPIKNIGDMNFPNPERRVLSNGIEVFSYNMGSQEVVQVELLFDVSRAEAKNPLVAKAVNELIGEASSTKAPGELSEAIDFYGAFLESSYSVDHSSVSFFSLSKTLNDVFPLFEEVILDAVFPERELDIYLTNAKQKFLIQMEKVDALVKRLYSKELYGDHYYGARTELKDFDEVRVADLEAFYKNYYTASNCTIFVSGRFDESLYDALESAFGKMVPGKKSRTFERIYSSPVKSVFEDKTNAIQSGLRLGKILNIDLGTQEYFQLKVFNTALGGYFGSRLMNNIREDKGYTYGIGSNISYMNGACVFSIATEVGAKVTKSALEEVHKELAVLCSEPLPVEELEVIKNYMLGSILRASDGPFSLMQQYRGVQLLGEDMSFFNRYIEVVKQVTADDVMFVAQKYVSPDTLLQAVVGKMD